MTSVLSRLTLTTVIATLLLAGCAHQPAARTTPAAASRTTTVTNTAASTSTSNTSTSTSGNHRQRQAAATASQVAADTKLPEHTGIAACDDYLSSYLACHRAAAIYAPDQLQGRYQAMRTSLLRDSKNPDISPQLAARCNSLAIQLRQALHGKSCAENPAPASTSP